MAGVLANGIGIILGGLLGFILGKKIKLKESSTNNILKVIGFVILVIGLAGIFKYMLKVNNEFDSFNITSQYELELLLFLSIGLTIGSFLKIDDNMYKLGDKIEAKLNKGKFSEAFVSASIVFCMGAMGIVGSINSALTNDNSILFTKALIDAIMAFIFATTMGFGVMFSGLSVIIYFTIFYLLGNVLSPFFSNLEFLSVFSMVGYSMVSLIGFNYLIWTNDSLKDNRIKIGNMLPSLIIVIIYYIFKIYVFKF